MAIEKQIHRFGAISCEPYDDICATLRNINHAIDELEKALR